MVIATFTDTLQALTNPVVGIWDSLVDKLPGLIGALIILIVGYFVSVVVGHAIAVVLERAGLDRQMKKLGLDRALGTVNLSELSGGITKWYIFILFLAEAMKPSLLNLGVISDLIWSLARWLPSAIVGLIVLIFGVYISTYVGERMLRARVWGIRLLTTIVRALILFFIAVIALRQMGLNVSILENTFLLLVGALAIGIAIALGIGLGLGLKGEAESLIKDLVKGTKR